MGKVSLHSSRRHLCGLVMLLVLLLQCWSAFAQTPQIRCEKKISLSQGVSVKAVDQFGFSASDFDLSLLPKPLLIGSNALDPTLASNVGIRRVIAPDVDRGFVVSGTTRESVSASPGDAQRCAEAVLDLNQIAASLTNPKYLCSMIELDRSCMTSGEAQPHVPDPTLPRISIVAFLLDETPFCSGMLLDEGRLVTVRHCFVDRGSGKLLTPISQAKQGSIRFETVDGSRSGTIQPSLLSSLELSPGFDIDQDSVQLDVSVASKSNAAPLPRVRLRSLTDDQQALWVAGPVNDLRTALVATATPGLSGDWRDGFRWSKYIGAQCRSRARSSDCIYHTCQTFVGFSGSPLITQVLKDESGPIIEYAGLHSGTPGRHPKGFERCLTPQAGHSLSDMGALNVGNYAK